MFFLFIILGALLIVNMLIAMMGNTYLKVAETEKEWTRQVQFVLSKHGITQQPCQNVLAAGNFAAFSQLFACLLHTSLGHGCHRSGNGQGNVREFYSGSGRIGILKKRQGKLKL